MTPQEELHYLTQLVLEASRWRVSEDQAEEDPLRLEITSRIYALQGIEPEVIDGRIQSVRERGLAKAEAKAKKKKQCRTKEGRQRIVIQGHRITVDCDKLVKVPHASSPTGYKWELIPGVTEEQLLEESLANAKKES